MPREYRKNGYSPVRTEEDDRYAPYQEVIVIFRTIQNEILVHKFALKQPVDPIHNKFNVKFDR